jgi:pyridinium-3,5-bisthiocarboxylic acid mononucleotide nickel chelatase
MRIAYLDCFAGISGDMFLGALVDAGVPPHVLHAAAAALNLNASLKIKTVDRSGISCTKVYVLEDGRLAEEQKHYQLHVFTHNHTHVHAEEADGTIQQQKPQDEMAYTQHPKTQHLHRTDVPHNHDQDHALGLHTDNGSHAHVHGRSLTVIRDLIQKATLDEPIKRTAIRAFEFLGHAEAKIHNVPIDEIHFHEVGAVDAIVDIVAASAGIHHLNIGAWHCSPLNVGGGMVVCAHGTFPVPAPATADLLRGYPTYSAHIQEELVTPTGAALLRALDPVFGQQPAMRVEQIGYGAGTRDPKNFPNALRLYIGEALDQATTSRILKTNSDNSIETPTNSIAEAENPARNAHSFKHQHHNTETVTVLETALDDLSPQILAYVAEKALGMGALDVMLTPVIMKKGRPGTLLTVLCNPSESHSLERLILRETSTLGIRIRQDHRSCLERSHTTVQTSYGNIRIKIGTLSGEELNAAPEFEDCRAAASHSNVPIKQVQQAAIAAYLQSKRT